MKINLKTVFFNLRRQPVISIVTIIGTALAIFLIMVVVMMSEVGTAPIAPESNRPRMLHSSWTSIKSTDGGFNESNGPMAYSTFKSLFSDMETPEAVTAYNYRAMSKALVQQRGDTPVQVVYKGTDDVYWRVFDYDFIAGQPYSKAEFEAGAPVAVISENTARAIFGSTDVVGREFLLNFEPFTVRGVIKDVSDITTRTYAQVFVPFLSKSECNSTWNETMGMLSVTFLARTPDDFDKIRDEYNVCVARFNKQIADTKMGIITRGRPYDQTTEALSKGANLEPDVAKDRRERMVIFVILLLVPAINLSSMTESRLRGRMSEIGVRRAFGCTRSETMMMILSENLVVTVIAGIIGLMLSVVFAYFCQDFLFGDPATSAAVLKARISVTSLLHWSTFGWALLFCFILNLLSTGIPAWRASRCNIVEAISGLRK